MNPFNKIQEKVFTDLEKERLEKIRADKKKALINADKINK
jgi:hypothetical protein